jgi:hypothetical protein
LTDHLILPSAFWARAHPKLTHHVARFTFAHTKHRKDLPVALGVSKADVPYENSLSRKRSNDGKIKGNNVRTAMAVTSAIGGTGKKRRPWSGP